MRIGISGSYGGLNLGDEAILESILNSVREGPGADVVVFSRNPEDTRARHDVNAVPVRTMTKEESAALVKTLDLLIFGGGGILYDDEVNLYLREVFLAHEARVPVMCWGLSAGPLDEEHHRKSVRDALNGCAAVTVRDRHAQRLLQDLGVTGVQLTADPALLLPAAKFPEHAWAREGLSHARHLVAFSVREPGPAAPDLDVEHYHALVANAADFVIDRLEAEVVFVPMERSREDVQHSHAVIGKMRHATHASVLRGEYGSGQMLALFQRFDFAVGMRLHFLMFAARQNVPFVSLPYSGKVEGFIEDLEMPSPPALSSLNIGTLLAHIDRTWDFRSKLREKMAANLPRMVARARENEAVLRRVLDTRAAA